MSWILTHITWVLCTLIIIFIGSEALSILLLNLRVTFMNWYRADLSILLFVIKSLDFLANVEQMYLRIRLK